MILMAMTTTTTDDYNGKTTDLVDKDDKEDPNGNDGELKDNDKRRPIFRFEKQPTCGQMHSWQGGGVILTAMTTTTTDNDNGKNN